MQKENYQRKLDQLLLKLRGEGRVPALLLHACCAPCSSYTLEYLSQYFDITLFFYNPNIAPGDEYGKRLAEVRRLVEELPLARPVQVLAGAYEPERFAELARGREELPEGGERCFACYALRLSEAAKAAKQLGSNYFTTTLSISPHKNADKLNEIGASLAQQAGIPYLYSDFKKKGGYQRSIELSRDYGLYRQAYCGCIYSKHQAEKRMKERDKHIDSLSAREYSNDCL